MTELKELLNSVGIKNALVIDDAFDDYPRASDLSGDIEEWNVFVADLTTSDHDLIANFYPLYQTVHIDELRESDEFFRQLWANKNQLPPELVDPLFLRYSTEKAADRKVVDDLVAALGVLGLVCKTCGRDFKDEADDADLIFIDLYLNSAQKAEDLDISINGLAEVIRKRKGNHPLVALMSNSTRLHEKRSEFQRRTALFESCFRIIRKPELAKPPMLNKLLVRLGTHYIDSKKVIAFVGAWDASLTAAKNRTTDLMRKMRLSDIAQINRLLLDAEGEPTGSYLVDIFDKVLQHEIEGEQLIIDAALSLNEISNSAYPPPFVPGSSDLQDLVYKSLFQNKARLTLSGSTGNLVALGDVLMRKPVIVGEVAEAPGDGSESTYFTRLLSEVGEDGVLVVLTPACDLQRTGAKKVLLLVGKLNALTAASWSYKPDTKTPVVQLPNGTRHWIKWDLRHVETLSHGELSYCLQGPQATFELVARLRESHALELQQKLLANFGRVGLMAVMPATFQMRVEVGVADANGQFLKLEIPVLNDGGTCFIGRNNDKDAVEMLVLTETACEAIYEAISTLSIDNVHARAKPSLTAIQQSGDLLRELEKGLTLPRPGSNNFKELLADRKPIGLIRRERVLNGHQIEPRDLPKGAIIFTVFAEEVTVQNV